MSATHTAPTGARPWVRWTTIAVVIVIVAAALGFWYYRANRTGLKVSAQFTTAVGVYPGSDVRILGVAVGAVDSVSPDGTFVVVTMHLDPDVKVAADTKAVVVAPNLVSDRYIQLTGVYSSGAQLKSGTTIPLASTATPVELDTLYRNLIQLTGALGPDGANKNGALSDLFTTAAANLRGNGTAFNDTVTNLSDAAATLNDSKQDVFLTVDHLAAFTGMLARNNSALITVNENLASVSQTLANDRESFGAAIQELGSALGKVQRFISDNRSLISSNVAKLQDVANTLADERDGLVQSLRAAPLLVQNLIKAYDPEHKVLSGRTNLNELSIWNTTGSTSSADEVPMLLPGAGSR